MKSLIEELKNNFDVEQKSTMDEFTRISTDWFNTHNKAVDAMIKLLQDKGYTKIVLPYMPVPYVIDDRDGNHQGVISLVE